MILIILEISSLYATLRGSAVPMMLEHAYFNLTSNQVLRRLCYGAVRDSKTINYIRYQN